MSSQVTVEKLAEYMQRLGWKHFRAENEPQEREGIIYTGWRSSPETRAFDMTIDPMEEKNCLSFKVYRLVKAPWDNTPPDRLADLLTLLTWINFDIILGKFGYDVRDGEVRLSIDVPIDECSFTYAQFEHTMRVLVAVAEQWEPAFRALLDGTESVESLIVAHAGRRSGSERLVQQLEQAARRRAKKLPDKDEPLTEV